MTVWVSWEILAFKHGNDGPNQMLSHWTFPRSHTQLKRTKGSPTYLHLSSGAFYLAYHMCTYSEYVHMPFIITHIARLWEIVRVKHVPTNSERPYDPLRSIASPLFHSSRRRPLPHVLLTIRLGGAGE